MNRKFYLDLAASGHRMPIGTHLVLHHHADADQIIQDGKRLGGVIAETAEKYRTPFAIPLMDLTLEKAALLAAYGVPVAEVDSFHFTEIQPAPAQIALTSRMKTTCEAIAEVAKRPGLVPMGMCIGPFSLMTKLLSDPITPVFLAGSGLGPEDEAEVGLLNHVMKLGEAVIVRYLEAQIAAGAKAIIVCEPAANLVYFSPKQLAESHEVFDRYVMEPMQRLVALLKQHGVDLVFHDCGELTEGMVRRFATLGAAMISFGCSRKLWEDATLIPKDTVLYGNLPTKRFYATQLTVADVEKMAVELIEKMKQVGHPFILGSECDVLSVPGAETEILGKVDAFMRCGCGRH